MAAFQESDLAVVPLWCAGRSLVVLPDGHSLDGSVRSLRNEYNLPRRTGDIRWMGPATDLHDYDSNVRGSIDRRVATSLAFRQTVVELRHGQSNGCYCPVGSWQPVSNFLECFASSGKRRL